MKWLLVDYSGCSLIKMF
jgi:hypothetical protein